MKPIIIFVHGFFFFSAGLLICFLALYTYLWKVGIVPDFLFYLATFCGGTLAFLNIRHILLNWVYLDGLILVWSYSTFCYGFGDLLSFSSIRHRRSLDGLSAISKLDLRHLPCSLTLTTIGQLRDQLFVSPPLICKLGSLREQYSTFIFQGGDSFVFYTQPYPDKGLSKLYHYLKDSGVKLIG